MSVKKILLLSAAGVAAVGMTAAMAGGYTHEPAASAGDGFYIEGHLGYAHQNYFDDQKWRLESGVDTNNHNNARGGFAAGVDTGYRIDDHYAVELGWFHLPSVNVASTSYAPVYLKSWALYLAGKYMLPLPWMNSTDWFFKLGVMYRDAAVSKTASVTSSGALGKVTYGGISNGSSTYVRPMFATGLDYSFSDAWSGIMQYAYFMGARNSFPFVNANTGSLGTVAANVFTLGLGYKFTV